MSDTQDAAWFAAITGAAASLEDAAVCMLDSDAKKAALGAAEFYRKRAASLLAARHAPTGVDALTDFDLIEHAKDHAGVSTATGDESDIEFHFDREDMLSCLRALLAKRGAAS